LRHHIVVNTNNNTSKFDTLLSV